MRLTVFLLLTAGGAWSQSVSTGAWNLTGTTTSPSLANASYVWARTDNCISQLPPNASSSGCPQTLTALLDVSAGAGTHVFDSQFNNVEIIRMTDSSTGTIGHVASGVTTVLANTSFNTTCSGSDQARWSNADDSWLLLCGVGGSYLVIPLDANHNPQPAIFNSAADATPSGTDPSILWIRCIGSLSVMPCSTISGAKWSSILKVQFTRSGGVWQPNPAITVFGDFGPAAQLLADWSANASYAKDATLNPTLNNASRNTYRNCTAGTSGTSEPNWAAITATNCSATNGFATDGTAKWIQDNVWGGTPLVSNDDQWFFMAIASGQDVGRNTAVYNASWNASAIFDSLAGTITGAAGWQGSTGTCPTCICPYHIHNTVTYQNGWGQSSMANPDLQACVSAHGVCNSAGEIWDAHTNVVTQVCGGGHGTQGYSYAINGTGTGQYKIRPVSNVNGSYAGMIVPTSAPYPGDTHAGQHLSWVNDDAQDQNPIAVITNYDTSILGAPGFGQSCSTAPCVFPEWGDNEAILINCAPSSNGTCMKTSFSRIAHTFITGCNHGTCPGGLNMSFDAQSDIGGISRAGTLVCWTSDWMLSLGLDKSQNPRSDVFCAVAKR